MSYFNVHWCQIRYNFLDNCFGFNNRSCVTQDGNIPVTKIWVYAK